MHTMTASTAPSLRAQFSKLPKDWGTLLHSFIASRAYEQLCDAIAQARAARPPIYPDQVFHALHLTPVDQVKVVILGQDPYHGIDRKSGKVQAHGLAFSVPPGVKPPPSLNNIFKELHRDLQCPIPDHGCLHYWAKQGVLLLNTVLTVVAERAGSHADIGWAAVTDLLLRGLAQHHQQQRKLIVMLWGSHAQAKIDLFDGHIILQTSHPSPLSAYRGFHGCGHFSQANQALIAAGQAPIDWCLPEAGVIV